MIRTIFRLMLVGFMTLSPLLFSCSSGDSVGEPSPELLLGSTVFVPYEDGKEIKIVMRMEDEWQLSSDIDWAAIYPMSGEAGDVTLTFRTTEANAGVWERTAYFEIETGENILNCLLVQEGRPGTSPVSGIRVFNGEDEGTLSVEVWTNAEFSASIDCPWAVVDGIRYGLDSVLLDDDRSYSAMQRAVVDVRMPAYSSEATVTADLLLECGEYVDTVRIYRSFVDKKRDFYRKSVLFNFTGQGCSWCPYMTDGIYSALEMVPNRIEVMKLYGYTDYEELYTTYAAEFDEFFSKTFSTGAPYSVFNFYAGLQSHGYEVELLTSRLAALSEEAVRSSPAETAIYAESICRDGIFKVSGFVISKGGGEYRISAFIREDGIIANQAGRGNDYEHNFVLRSSLVDVLGLDMVFIDGVAVFDFSCNLSDIVMDNPDNVSVLLYTSRMGESVSGVVDGATYIDLGMTVDNAVSLPLDGKVDIRYE